MALARAYPAVRTTRHVKFFFSHPRYTTRRAMSIDATNEEICEALGSRGLSVLDGDTCTYSALRGPGSQPSCFVRCAETVGFVNHNNASCFSYSFVDEGRLILGVYELSVTCLDSLGTFLRQCTGDECPPGVGVSPSPPPQAPPSSVASRHVYDLTIYFVIGLGCYGLLVAFAYASVFRRLAVPVLFLWLVAAWPPSFFVLLFWVFMLRLRFWNAAWYIPADTP
jgi:hypothetical protein